MGSKSSWILRLQPPLRCRDIPFFSFLVDAKTSYDLAIDNSQVAQICMFVYQYSICTWLKQLGVEPQDVLGHSLGEIAATGAYTTLFFFFHLSATNLLESC